MGIVSTLRLLGTAIRDSWDIRGVKPIRAVGRLETSDVRCFSDIRDFRNNRDIRGA